MQGCKVAFSDLLRERAGWGLELLVWLSACLPVGVVSVPPGVSVAREGRCVGSTDVGINTPYSVHEDGWIPGSMEAVITEYGVLRT